MRRATRPPNVRVLDTLPISIHALHEESDFGLPSANHRLEISIHALHEESDGGHDVVGPAFDISIHALHEESDFLRFSAYSQVAYFNPRSP